MNRQYDLSFFLINAEKKRSVASNQSEPESFAMEFYRPQILRVSVCLTMQPASSTVTKYTRDSSRPLPIDLHSTPGFRMVGSPKRILNNVVY
jgi:hypothetical protein